MNDEKQKTPDMDEVLRRMLAMPPEPHKKSPSAKKKQEKPKK